MVALVVIGLLASAVVLNMPDPRGRLVDEGEAFAARARAAQEAAIIESRDIALWVSSAGYGFERLVAGNWTSIDLPPFQDRHWPADTRVGFSSTTGERARVIFDATGLNQALDVSLEREEVRVKVAIGADGTIHVGS
jgi:general secretion pathway protein H